MIASDAVLEALHKKSLYNEDEILRYKICCCFCCLKTYDSAKIQEWIDEADNKPRSAICPFCSVDSVLANNPNDPISEDLLTAMEAKYFGIRADYIDEQKATFNSFTEMVESKKL